MPVPANQARTAAHHPRLPLVGPDSSNRLGMGSSPVGYSPRLMVGPIEGKTYSLYGLGTTTEPYFTALAEIVEAALGESRDPARPLAEISRAGRSRRAARRAATVAGSLQGVWREGRIPAALSAGSRGELRGQAPRPRRRLPGMLGRRYVNAVSLHLRRHRVRPYIWMNASLGRLLREKAEAAGGFGMLGIACNPELVAGMRRCARGCVPVRGLPLDANRCARWLGVFRPNTVNLARLDKLVADSTSDRSTP